MEFLYLLLSMLDKSQPVHLVVDMDNSAEQAEVVSLSTDEMTAEIIKYLEPGEICLINKTGVVQKRKGTKSKKVCAFLWIYTGINAVSIWLTADFAWKCSALTPVRNFLLTHTPIFKPIF